MLHPLSKQSQWALHNLFTNFVVTPNYGHNVDPMILFKFLFTWSVLVPNETILYWCVSELPIKEYSFCKLWKEDLKAFLILWEWQVYLPISVAFLFYSYWRRIESDEIKCRLITFLWHMLHISYFTNTIFSKFQEIYLFRLPCLTFL